MPTEESLRVVLNTSPIIVLTKLRVLNEALNLFSEVEIPSGVLEELERKKDEVYQELMRTINEGKIRIENVKRKLPRLGIGESSAILLALVKDKIVILDDKKARRLARELGLEVIGTLSILKKLHELDILAEPPSTIYKRLIEIGFYIDKKLFDRLFQRQ
jgi:predicted nucleic acid-binding protein